jgi:hypothetical protein
MCSRIRPVTRSASSSPDGRLDCTRSGCSPGHPGRGDWFADRGAAGLAPLAALVSVQPLDEAGNPTPAWSLKVHIALLAVALTGLPPAAFLLAGWLGQLAGLRWVAVPAGLVTGACLAGWLGQRAVARLERRQVPILRLLADAAR